MNTDDTQTWISSGYKKYCNDYFRAKNSEAESSDYVPRFSDGPAATRSRAALMLTEVEEQLEASETRFNSVKDRLDYMTMLYLGAGTVPSQIVDSKSGEEAPITENSSPRDTILNSPIDDEKGSDDNVASEPSEHSPRCSARSYNVSPGRNIYHGVHDENSNDSERRNYFSETNGDGMENFARDELTENIVAEDVAKIRGDHGFDDISPRRQHPYQLHLAEYSKSIHEEFEANSRDPESIMTDRYRETCYDDRTLRPIENQSKAGELFLNLTESAESLSTMMNKKSRSDKHRRTGVGPISGNKKNVSKQQIDDTLCGTSKIRRKKRKVRASNSRSTTATRDTRVTVETKKDARKRKQRGNPTMPASQSSQNRRDITTKIQRNWSEAVDVYYDNAQKTGSLSVVSSNHSRLESQEPNVKSANTYADQRSAIIDLREYTKNIDHPKSQNNDNSRSQNNDNSRSQNDDNSRSQNNDNSRSQKNETKIRRSSKSRKNNQSNDGEEIRTQSQTHNPALRENSNDLRSEESKRTKLLYRAECPTIHSDNNIPEEVNDRRNCSDRNPESHDCLSTSYDPFATKNYELPTVASKMKRVDRSYFNRFNFKNIPFVVGTSVTPSYNLGLNIQEALSLIKTRQMMPGGVTQLLINKVGKGSERVSTLTGCVGARDEISVEDSGFRFGVGSTEMSNVYSKEMADGDGNEKTELRVGPFSLQQPRIIRLPTNPSFFENNSARTKTFGVSSSKKNKIRSICSSMKMKLPKNSERHLQLTQSSLLKQRQDELSIEDSKTTKWQQVPQNMNGIRDVLANFHDQLEAMNTKYEKLQEEAEKSNDETLMKEKAILEKELTAKEDEIQAVVNLYMEVMALKQQMKLLHERNSLVCIATESPGSPTYPQISSRTRATNPMFNIYKRCGSGLNRGPSTSTKLAGLLRQIKIFQKQLKSAA